MHLLCLVLLCCLARLASGMSLQEAIDQMNNQFKDPGPNFDDSNINSPSQTASNLESAIDPSLTEEKKQEEAVNSEAMSINEGAQSNNDIERQETVDAIDPSLEGKLDEVAKKGGFILNDDAKESFQENKQTLVPGPDHVAGDEDDTPDMPDLNQDAAGNMDGASMVEAERLKSMMDLMNNDGKDINANSIDNAPSEAGGPGDSQATGGGTAGPDHLPEDEETEADSGLDVDQAQDFVDRKAADGMSMSQENLELAERQLKMGIQNDQELHNILSNIEGANPDQINAAGVNALPGFEEAAAAIKNHVQEDVIDRQKALPGFEEAAAAIKNHVQEDVIDRQKEAAAAIQKHVQEDVIDRQEAADEMSMNQEVLELAARHLEMGTNNDRQLNKIISNIDPAEGGADGMSMKQEVLEQAAQHLMLGAQNDLKLKEILSNIDPSQGASGLEETFDESVQQTADSQKVAGFPIPYPKPLPYSKPPFCPHPCCDTRKTKLNLHYKNPDVINNLDASVEIIQSPTAWNSKHVCSRTALLKVHFEKITRYPCPGLCINGPFCGNRMLRIDLFLHKYRAGGKQRMFNIGDSETNDGYGGDGGTQNYDAEIDGRNNKFYVYGNDHCERRTPFVFTNALHPNVKKLTMWISNEFIRVKNYGACPYGCDQEMCSECLFALNGQHDITVNTDVYVALNRVVSGRPDRNGYGVCAAELSWACPWHPDCPAQPCDIV